MHVHPLTRWHTHFMKMAKLTSELSKDRSTQVGCVITTLDNVVLSTGYNGFPRGVFDDKYAVDTHTTATDNGTPIIRKGLFLHWHPNEVVEAVEARHSKPAKYLWTEHAERNAIYNVARNGGSGLRQGARIYVPWFPCAECARAIVQSGITEIVAYPPDFEHPKWGPEFKVTVEMFEEAGVSVHYVERLPEPTVAAIAA